MKQLFIALLLMASFPAKSDPVEFSAYTLIAMDWMQTVEISHNDKFYETNPYLGKYPSERDVHYYMAARMLFTYYMNQTEMANIWNWYIVLETGGAVFHNYRAGVTIHF